MLFRSEQQPSSENVYVPELTGTRLDTLPDWALQDYDREKWLIDPSSVPGKYYITSREHLDPSFCKLNDVPAADLTPAEFFGNLKGRAIQNVKESLYQVAYVRSYRRFHWCRWPSLFFIDCFFTLFAIFTLLVFLMFFNICECFCTILIWFRSPYVKTTAFLATLRGHWRGLIRKFISFLQIWCEFALDAFVKRWFVLTLCLIGYIVLAYYKFLWVCTVIGWIATIYPVWVDHLDKGDWDDTNLFVPWSERQSEEAAAEPFLEPLKMSPAVSGHTLDDDDFIHIESSSSE